MSDNYTQTQLIDKWEACLSITSMHNLTLRHKNGWFFVGFDQKIIKGGKYQGSKWKELARYKNISYLHVFLKGFAAYRKYYHGAEVNE